MRVRRSRSFAFIFAVCRAAIAVFADKAAGMLRCVSSLRLRRQIISSSPRQPAIAMPPLDTPRREILMRYAMPIRRRCCFEPRERFASFVQLSMKAMPPPP